MLGSFVIVQGNRTSIAMKPLNFCDFSGGGGGPDPLFPPPPLDPRHARRRLFQICGCVKSLNYSLSIHSAQPQSEANFCFIGGQK